MWNTWKINNSENKIEKTWIYACDAGERIMLQIWVWYIIASDIKNIAPRDAANIILANNVRLIFSAAHNDLLNFYLTMCNNNNNI